MLHSRIIRVSELVKAEVGQILLTEMKDPRLGFVTVCRAKVGKDLRRALIFVSVLQEDQVEETMAVLQSAKGFIRKLLGERIVLKYLPELEFIYDDNTRHAGRIAQLLEEIHQRDGQPDGAAAEEDPADDSPQDNPA